MEYDSRGSEFRAPGSASRPDRHPFHRSFDQPLDEQVPYVPANVPANPSLGPLTRPSSMTPLDDQPVPCTARLQLSEIAQSWPSLRTLIDGYAAPDTMTIAAVLGQVAAEVSRSAAVIVERCDLLRRLTALEEEVRTWRTEYLTLAAGSSALKRPRPSSLDDDDEDEVITNWPFVFSLPLRQRIGRAFVSSDGS